MAAFLFQWRSIVASLNGPASPTTRHVLLTLSLHMDENGQNAWPSMRLLAERTGLSRRVVGVHLALAESDGWLARRPKSSAEDRNHARHAGFIYTPKVPASVVEVVTQSNNLGGNPASPPRPSYDRYGGNSGAEGGNSGAGGGYPERMEVATQGNSNSSVNSSSVTLQNNSSSGEPVFSKEKGSEQQQRRLHNYDGSPTTPPNNNGNSAVGETEAPVPTCPVCGKPRIATWEKCFRCTHDPFAFGETAASDSEPNPFDDFPLPDDEPSESTP